MEVRMTVNPSHPLMNKKNSIFLGAVAIVAVGVIGVSMTNMSSKTTLKGSLTGASESLGAPAPTPTVTPGTVTSGTTDPALGPCRYDIPKKDPPPTRPGDPPEPPTIHIRGSGKASCEQGYTCPNYSNGVNERPPVPPCVKAQNETSPYADNEVFYCPCSKEVTAPSPNPPVIPPAKP